METSCNHYPWSSINEPCPQCDPNKCNHYPWATINEPCPECDPNKCNHYPWVTINEPCPQCDNDKEKFYCMPCDKYTKHISKAHNILNCEKCDTIKTQIYFNTNHIPKLNKTLCIGRKCPNCNIHNVKYMVAKFTHTTNGITNRCIDTNRPTCEICHYLVCEDISHLSCKVLRANL